MWQLVGTLAAPDMTALYLALLLAHLGRALLSGDLAPVRTRTRITRTNTIPNGAEANAAG